VSVTGFGTLDNSTYAISENSEDPNWLVI